MRGCRRHLVNGTAYTFTVTATNAIGTGAASAASNSVTPAAAATVPGAPVIGTATAGNTTASVTFAAPASNGGSAITSFTATSSPSGITATGAASPLVVSGLVNGTAYTFTVTATNAIGTGAASAASNSVTPATVPGAPTAVLAFPGDASALVDFAPPVSDGGSPITSFTVTSSPGGITAIGPINPILVLPLANGTAFTFTVTATNAVGTGAPSAPSISVTPLPVPGAPTIISVAPNPGPNVLTELLVTFAAPGVGAPFTSFTVTATDLITPGPLPPFIAVGATSPIIVTVVNTANTHTIDVFATNTSGSGPPFTVTATNGVF